MFRKDRRRETMKKVAIGSTVAAAAGYVAGVLTAPKSGKETRKDIKKAADKGRSGAEKELKKLHTELDNVMKETKSRSGKASAKAQKEAAELLEKGKASKEKARKVLSALHSGDAEDADLKKAVNEAKTSLQHLKDYLKK